MFRVVYGCDPTREELKQVETPFRQGATRDELGMFRSVVNGFSHYVHPTPVVVRFAERDLRFVTIDGVQVAVDLHDHGVSHYVIGDAFEKHLKPVLMDRLAAGATFVDIAANLGLYSLLAADRVGPGGRVVSFEPLSENCRMLLVSAARNDFDNIELHPVALGPDAGYALFTTSMGSNGGFLGQSEGGLLHDGAVVVPTASLDDMFTGDVDLLKVDVEGGEPMVIAGAEKTIARCRPVVISEFSPEMLHRVSGCSAIDYLAGWRDRGYDLSYVRREDGEVVAIDDHRAFMANYGDETRIEDLLLTPQ